MTDQAETLFKEQVQRNLEYCSRCFKKTVDQRHRQSIQAGSTMCGKDCGSMNASLETDSIPLYKLLDRGKRLYTILESNEIELKGSLFKKAIQYHAESSLPPKKVFLQAIKYGLGHGDEDDIEIDIEDEESEGIANYIAANPITEEDIDYDNLTPELKDQIAVFNIPIEGTDNIYYLKNPSQFREEFDAGWIGTHSSAKVVRKALKENKHLFWTTSSENIQNWIESADDEFSKYIIPQSLHVISFDDDYRSTSFWPIAKPLAQDILRCLRGSSDGKLTSTEIAEREDLSQYGVNQLLHVLYENESVEMDSGENKETEWSASSPH